MSEPTEPTVSLTVAKGTRRGQASIAIRMPGGKSFSDEINVLSAKARDKCLQRVESEYSAVDTDELKYQLEAVALAWTEASDSAEGKPATRAELLVALDERAASALDDMPNDAVAAAEELLRSPALLDQVLDDLDAIGVVGEQELAASIYLMGTSRLLKKPLSGIIQGTSSSGKSFVLNRVSDLLPDACKLVATDITQNALYYLPIGRLMHQLVIAGERPRGHDDDRAQATRALREMIESGELRKAIPMKDRDGSGMTTRVIWQPGPIAFLESTTATEIFDEDANRCLLLGTDETREQTERVLLAQAMAASRAPIDRSDILLRHHALQLMLRRVEVVIPFAGEISRAMPCARQEARRALPQILGLVRAVATLHQFQRRPGAILHGDCIEATLADYVIARNLLCDPLGRALGGGLPGAAARFGNRVVARYRREAFTSTDAVRDDDQVSSKSKGNEYLRTLEQAGVVTCEDPGKGSRPATWRVVGEVPVAGAAWLPTLGKLGASESCRPPNRSTSGQQRSFIEKCWSEAAPKAVGQVRVSGGNNADSVGANPPAPDLPQEPRGSNGSENHSENPSLPQETARERDAKYPVPPSRAAETAPEGSVSEVMLERLGIADELGMCSEPGSLAWNIAAKESLPHALNHRQLLAPVLSPGSPERGEGGSGHG